MVLFNCPECGIDIYDKIDACPQCGYPFNYDSDKIHVYGYYEDDDIEVMDEDNEIGEEVVYYRSENKGYCFDDYYVCKDDDYYVGTNVIDPQANEEKENVVLLVIKGILYVLGAVLLIGACASLFGSRSRKY